MATSCKIIIYKFIDNIHNTVHTHAHTHKHTHTVHLLNSVCSTVQGNLNLSSHFCETYRVAGILICNVRVV